MAVKTGQILLHYRLVDKIGEGGMGQVWRALDTRLGREVAVKVLPEHLSADEGALARFEREARAVAALSHPNILALYDVGETDGVPFAVTELLDGQTLRQRLADGPLPVRTALEVALQIVGGLAAAHARGLVHRDLKPDNVFLTRDGHLKLLDFGLAKLTAEPPKSGVQPTEAPTRTSHTIAGTILGTIGYMAPEQARGQEADHRSDVFSFGAVLFEMLTGQRAFDGPSAADVLSAILGTDPPPLALASPAGPILDQLVRRCLRKRPEERFQSARDLGYALQSVLAMEGQASSDATRPPVVAPPSASGAPPEERPSGVSSSAAHEAPSIAVLPFADMSPRKDQDYFCEGMAEEILAALSDIAGLRVASRTSAFRFKGKTQDIREIGEALGVAKVLEGSVRTAGSRLRVTAQLVNVADGYRLWSGRYDREMEDVFAIQDEIARAVVEALEVQLAAPPGGSRAQRHSEDLEAYHLYLKGRHLRYGNAYFLEARRHFEKATERDPRYALAHAGVAETCTLAAIYGLMRPAIALPWAADEVRYAKALAGESAEVLAIEAVVRAYQDRDWNAAVELGRRAGELDPQCMLAHTWFSMVLSALGRHEEAVAATGRARDADPLAPYGHSMLGWALNNARRHQDAIEACRPAIAIEAGYPLAVWNTGIALAALDRVEEAVTTFEGLVGRFPAANLFLGMLAWGLARAGRRAEARHRIDELRRRRQWSHYPSTLLAWALAALGETAEALDELALAAGDHDPMSNHLALPGLDPLRDEERFRAVAERLGVSADAPTG